MTTEKEKIRSMCVCDPESWADPEDIPDVCSCYVPIADNMCMCCKHPVECHIDPQNPVGDYWIGD